MGLRIFCVYYKDVDYEVASDWLTPISAGDLSHSWTEKGKYTDSAGQSINRYNKYFCELTAHFSAWKNDFYGAEYAGFYHYRRYLHFYPNASHQDQRIYVAPTSSNMQYLSGDAQRDVILKILGEFDIVTPRPLISKLSIADHFKLEHDENIWEVFLDGIRHLLPQYASRLNYFDLQNELLLNNMFIAKKDVCARYFEYLFAILGYVIDSIGIGVDGGSERFPLNRYPAFLTERFLPFFIHAEKLTAFRAQQVILEQSA